MVVELSTEHRRVPTPGWRLRRSLEQLPIASFAWIALGVYLIVSLSIYWPQLPGATHSLVQCPCGDIMQEVWFLKWTPWAIAHGHNPLFTNWMDYPTGANLATNTVMPALALLAAPVTWLWGPVSSYNLLMWASFPVSGIACWYVLRRWSGSNLAALVGGALYGFSPYMIAQGYGHLFLIFVPLPPLIFYALYRICVTQDVSARRWGLILGALVVVQYFISQEVAADVAIVAFFALAILAVAQRDHLDATRVGYVVRAAFFAAALTLPVLAFPVYFEIFGPQAIHAATHGTTHSPLKLDVLGTIVPDRLQLLHPSFLTRLGDQFMGTDIAENGSYLGLPLVVALGVIVWTQRRHRGVLYVALLLAVTEVLSMGRWLMIANHTIHVPLPWAAIARLPLLQSDLPNRFALFASFFVAVLVALGLAHWSGGAPTSPRRGDRRRGVNISLSALALASAVVYVPLPRVGTAPLNPVPVFFTTPDVLQIPEGSVVLPFPLSASPFTASMYWQIRSDFRWKMIGGEAIVPASHDRVTGQPAPTRPVAVLQFIEHYTGAATRLPTFDEALVVRMREFLYLNRVGTVIEDPSAPNADKVDALFVAAMGPARSEGGVKVWFHAQQLARYAAAKG